MVERGGQAVAKVVPDVKAKTLLPMILEHVPAGQTVYTDEMFSYNRLSSLGYMHDTVRHSAKEYVAGRVHTNNIEGMWSNVKRGIDGVNHSVSPKHLQSYLDSYVYRFNHRKRFDSDVFSTSGEGCFRIGWAALANKRSNPSLVNFFSDSFSIRPS